MCIYADQCEIIGRSRYDGSDAFGIDRQLMKVHKCDGLEGSLKRGFMPARS